MSSEHTDMVRYERLGKTLHIILNRPHALNALVPEMTGIITRLIHDFDRDPDLLVAVISGEGGRAFSVGGDLKHIATQASEPTTGKRPGFPIPRYGAMHPYDEIESCSKPVIAAIDGYCVAGGFEMALMCDIRVATRQSSFGLPEPRRGMLAGSGLHQLSRVIPLGEALRLQLSGARMTAERAYEIGLIQELAADRTMLFQKVGIIADEIASCAPAAVAAIKHIVRRGREMTIAESWQLAAPFQETQAYSPEGTEGARAFAEKRPPSWSAEASGS